MVPNIVGAGLQHVVIDGGSRGTRCSNKCLFTSFVSL